MNNITMIPIERLEHHPENPRLDLGDLTELAESIRQNGIMQNLTVVAEKRVLTDEEWTALAQKYKPGTASEADRVKMNSRAGGREPQPVETGSYLVVIGNRRMEAAKLAGLATLPCVISDMSHEEQISTMLQENMQRSDLTVYEQAQGFQMMMNLGFTPEQIADKTGISQSTVRRRLKMAELDKDALKQACEAKETERQITLADFEKLAQVESVKERNALLKKIGGHDFDWQVRRAIQIQKATANKPAVKKIIKDAGLKKLEKDSDRYSGLYEHDWKQDVKLYDWENGKPLLPAVEGEIWYYMDDDTISFYTKKKRAAPDPANRKTEKEKAEEKRIAEAWAQIKKDSETARQLRREFAENMGMPGKSVGKMLCHMLIAATLNELSYCGVTTRLKEALHIESRTIPENEEAAAEAIWNMEMKDWPKLIAVFFDGDSVSTYVTGIQREMPRYQKNRILDEYYEWLCEFGYQMSDVEVQMMNGTHPSFARKEQ